MRKRLFFLVALCFTAGLHTNLAYGQEDKTKNQLFIIHEDVVKPSMVAQYEKAASDLVAKLKEHNIASFNYGAASTTDLHYLYVTPIKNMAELDINAEEEIIEKMGKDATRAMWEQFANCYDSHKNFLVTRLTDLSYQPESADNDGEQKNFIHWDYYHVQPGKGDEARSLSKEWRDLYASNNVAMGYNLYVGGIGTDMPLFVTTQRAKNAADFQMQSAKTAELLGDAGKDLNQRTMAITLRFESRDGWARPDLSYTPATKMTAK